MTPDKIADKDRLEAREQLIARAHEKLASQVLPRELQDKWLENTLQ